MYLHTLNKEIKILKYINIAHIFFSILSICIHIIGFKKLYFISKILYNFFKYLSILIILFTAIPITILIFLYKRNISSIKILRWIIFYFVFIFFIAGLLVNISAWKTSIEAESFIRNCPYHYNHFHLEQIIDKYFKNNKNKNFRFCDERFCYLNTEVNSNSLSYNYICNYDSSQDLNYKNDGTLYRRIDSNGKEILSNIYIACTQITSILTSDESLITYSNLCNHNIFYNCELFEKPKEKDISSINNKETCPEFNYKIISFLLSAMILLIDVICFSFIFLEIFALKKLILQNLGDIRNNSNLEHNNEYSTKIIKFDDNNIKNIKNKNEMKKEEEIKNEGIFSTKKKYINNVSLISENEKDNNKKSINELTGIQNNNKNPSFISNTGGITSSNLNQNKKQLKILLNDDSQINSKQVLKDIKH